MKNGRLWDILEQMSRRELNEVADCMRSPWFNKREYVVKLFDFLVECKEELQIIPDSKMIHARLFSEREFNDSRIRSAVSLVLKVVERWMALKVLEEDTANGTLALAKAYRRKKLQKHYDQTVRQTEAIFEKEPLRNADFYNDLYRFENEKYQSLSAQRKLSAINLQSLSDKLDIGYLSQKLRQTCISISHTRVYSKEYDFGLLQVVLEKAAQPHYQAIPAISLYYHGYFALTNPNEEHHFQQFKNQLFEFGLQFPKSELGDLYLLATNYCTKRVNEGAAHFAKESLDLYKEALRQKVLLNEGVLSHITFSNIVAFGLLTEDYDFTKMFLEKYKKLIAPKYRKPIYSLNRARYEYQRGNFDSALDFLQQRIYKDLVLNLSAKAIMAKIFFEMDATDLLFSHLDAMGQFIRRKKVMAYHQENFQNFISFLRKIVEIPDFEKAQRKQLKVDIESVKAVAERKWLLKQV